MRSPRQFQTRLALALALSIAAVSAAVLWITSRIVQQHEYSRFTAQFHAQVDYILKSRDQRSQGILKAAKELSTSPGLVRAFRTQPNQQQQTELIQAFGEILMRETQRPAPPVEGGGGGGGGGAGLLQAVGSRFGELPLVALVTLAGDVTPLSLSKSNVSRTGRRKLTLAYNLNKFDLASVLRENPQQVTYVSIPSQQGPEMVQEVIVTAVHSPLTDELLGAVLVGVPAETGAERLLDRVQQTLLQPASFKSGIFLGGQIYARNLPEESLESLAEVLKEKIRRGELHARSTTGREGREAGEFVLMIGDEPYRIHFCALNPDSSLPVAWHLAAFSLAETNAELRDIYAKGMVVGGLALFLALISATFLSRQLSNPIRALSAATNAIRQGQLDTRVPVRGRDELADLARSFNAMAGELRQKERFRELLEKVSDEAVAQAMISGSLDVQLGGELKEVSVLFCDVRGFSALAERLPPGTLITLLNAHMTLMTEVIRDCSGVVDKFIGDEVMALFGALKSYGNDAANAARAALRIVEERERGNAGAEVPFRVGIGIATGQVIAGCLGATHRLNYTVLGSRVNLASRLCDLAGPGQIVVDEATRERLGGAFRTSSLPPVTLKGFAQPVQAYRLEGLAETGHPELAPAAAPAVPVRS